MLNGKQIVRTENPASRMALYGIGVAGLGSSASLLFAMANSINPAILPVSIGLSSLVFGGASYYAYMRPKDSLLSWGRVLYPALIGLIGS